MENNVITCSSCGAENPDTFKFCSACGTELKKVEVLIKNCPRCNSVFETANDFCSNCGTRLVIPEPEVEEEEIEEAAPELLICESCGAENDFNFSFCASCGAKLNKPGMPKICPNCNTECAPEASFCTKCGTALTGKSPVAQPVSVAQPEPAPEVAAQPEPTPVAQPTREFAPAAQPKSQTFARPQALVMQPQATRPPRKMTFNLKKLICSGVLTVLSLVLLLFSFLPVAKSSIENSDMDISVKINAFDAVGFMFDTLKNQEYEDILDSKLGDKIEDLSDELEDEYDDIDDLSDLPRSANKTISKLVKLSYKMGLRSEDTKFSTTVFIGGIAALTYIALTFSAFVYAVLTLASVFAKTESHSDKSIKHLIIAPFMAWISAIALKLSNLTVFFNTMGSDDGAKTSSPLFIWGVIFAVVIVAARIMQSIIFEKKEFSIQNLITGSITFVLAIATVLLCTSNVMKAKVEAIFENKDTESTATVKVDPSIYTQFLEYDFDNKDDDEEKTKPKDQDKDVYKTMLSSLMKGYENYTVKEVKKGEADAHTDNVIVSSLSMWNSSLMTLFGFTSLFLILAAAFASLVAALALSKISKNEGSSGGMKTLAVFGMLFSVAACALTVCCTITVNSLCKYARYKAFELSLAGGIIALVIASIVLLIVTSATKQSKSKRSPGNTFTFNSWGERMETTRF